MVSVGYNPALPRLEGFWPVPDLKAISQNLMHTCLSITDGIHAILSENEIGDRIARFWENKPESTEAIIQQLETILEMLKNKLTF